MDRSLMLVLVLTASICLAGADEYLNPPLKFHFYRKSCPNLEKIVKERVAYYTALDPTTPAPLLRLFFHDCFVQGCDASVLLNSTQKSVAEKDSDNNFSLAKFEVINDIKSRLEAECPSVVSCADILAVAAVYAIKQAGGPLYSIELGRKDALTSYAQSASIILPGSDLSVDGLLQNFGNVGLDKLDLVTLSGAHTIGQGHCSSVSSRIYPTIDSRYNAKYAKQILYNCTDSGKLQGGNFDPNVQIFNDPITSLKFDNQYYKNVKNGLGLFGSDAALLSNTYTKHIVEKYAADGKAFWNQFGISLRKMGKIGVLTGSQGQIRQKCWIRNSHNADPAFDPTT